MAKAKLTLSNGTEVTIDGNQDELEKLLKVFSAEGGNHEKTPPNKSSGKTKRGKASPKSGRTQKGPMFYITELKNNKFFTKKKRSLDDVKQELNRQGHYYPSASLGVTLVRLVRKGEIRRIKESKKWLYTTSGSSDD